MVETGLTHKDIQIVNEVIKENEIGSEQTYSKKDILKVIHLYKKYKVKNIEEKQFSSKREFRKFIKTCLRRNFSNYDTMILLTADKGTGKSSAAIMMAKEWCKLIGIKFKPDRHIAYDNADVMEKIQKLNPFEPLIADEAIRFASAEDWNKAENKELKKVLGQVRTKHLFYVLCFPLKINKLQKEYLDSYVNYWIDLYDRGVGALYVKDKNPSTDAWNTKLFAKMGSWNEFSSPEQIEKRLSKHPNYWTSLSIPKVPKELYNRYLEVRETNVYNDKNVLDAMSKNDVYRSALLIMLKEIVTKDSSLSYDRVLKSIERLFNISIPKQSLYSLIRDAEMLVEKFKLNGLEGEEDK